MKTNPTTWQRRTAMLRFNERVRSLTDDGYHVSFRASGITSNLLWATLRHHNGNKVTIKAYVDENRIVQRTNHIVTHEGALY